MRCVARGVIVAALLALSLEAAAQPPGPPGPDLTIDSALRETVVEAVVRNVVDYYVFPDSGQQMATAIRQHHARHAYAHHQRSRSCRATDG